MLLLLGNLKVALIGEQQRQILGTCSHFPNGEIRDWMKNLTLLKEKNPKCMSSSVLHPALVCNRYFDGQAHTPPHEGQGCCTDCNLGTDWTVVLQCFGSFVAWVILSRTRAPRHIVSILCVCVPPMLLPFSRDTGESYRGGAGYTRSSDAPSLTSCTAPTVMNGGATWARAALLGGVSPSAWKLTAGRWLFLLFVCFNISLLIILKKKICACSSKNNKSLHAFMPE